MPVPASFIFSQSSLKDYRECARRFQLRYLERLAWPVPQSADALEAERRLRLGQDFHRLVRRHQAGLPAADLTRLAAGDVDLDRWWRDYLASPYASPAGPVRRAELTLSAPLAGYRLEAQYDLVVGTPGGDWLIVDWKTEQSRPRREALQGRLQTVVYRFLLALSGATLNAGQPIAPERISMVYWFAPFPLQPELYPYGDAQYAADGRALSALIEEIAARPEGDWPQTAEERSCRFCAYRSLCERQVALPTAAEAEAAGEIEDLLTPGWLEQVEEIAF